MTNPKKNGFTLLEILVAMTILAITLAALYAVFRTFVTSAELVKHDIQRQERFRLGMQVMAADLEQVLLSRPPRYHPPGFNEDPDMFRFVATKTGIGGNFFSQLQFTSLNHLDSGPTAIHGTGRILYYVHRHGNRFDLHRSDRSYLSEDNPDPCRDPVLIKDIHAFSLTFTDSRGTEHTIWDSDADAFAFTLPTRVIIDIQTAQEESLHRIKTAVFLPISRKVEK
ncbi:MAG: type II secretion system protein J [Desulfotignum sp.]|nr:prepilin-type N-terminal cleavage/methylation domain-containing protein [Desulfobacteraceae bacterium]